MDVEWKVDPIRVWPSEPTRERRRSPFRAGWAQPARKRNGEPQWGAKSTLQILNKELEHLDAENVRIQMALTDRDIRKDGKPRADARPTHPGIILTFDSIHGSLSYPCDAFDDWQANVHAVALALEALRKVDRYGITKHGEQYTGWKQIPGPGGTTTTMTSKTAAEIILDAAGWPLFDYDHLVADVLRDPEAFRSYYRNAAACTHPDRHDGDTEHFQLVQQAKDVLNAHHGL